MISFDQKLRPSAVSSCVYFSVTKTLRVSRGKSLAMEEIQKHAIDRFNSNKRLIDVTKTLTINCRMVYKVKKLYEETGDFKKQAKGGWPRSARTPAMIQSIKSKIAENPI